MTMVALRYDLRVPAFASTTHAAQYRACLDQCAWGDEHGVDAIVLSEHHGTDDGYMPAPVTLAAAIAGCTRRAHLTISALLVPLHDPVRLAEQLATVDVLSGGRIGFIAGLGYRYEEFEMAGVDRKQRGRLLPNSFARIFTALSSETEAAVTVKNRSGPLPSQTWPRWPGMIE